MSFAVQQSQNITVPTTIANATTALASNLSRIGWGIQNQGTNPLFVLMGAGASTTVYHKTLQAATAVSDGKGGSYEQISGTVYNGIVTVAGTSPLYSVYEIAP